MVVIIIDGRNVDTGDGLIDVGGGGHVVVNDNGHHHRIVNTAGGVVVIIGGGGCRVVVNAWCGGGGRWERWKSMRILEKIFEVCVCAHVCVDDYISILNYQYFLIVFTTLHASHHHHQHRHDHHQRRQR